MRPTLPALAMIVMPCAVALGAPACPASSPAQMDVIVTAIAKAPGCRPAYQLMEACAFGSSADVQTGAAVVEKCEPDIPPRLRSTFERDRAACIARYTQQDGTMYRSMAAFCVARAAMKHSAAGGRPAK